MKKIVIGIAAAVVLIVVLFGAYTCSTSKDSSGTNDENAVKPAETATKEEPVVEKKEEPVVKEKKDEPVVQKKEPIKEKPAKVNVNPADRKPEKRAKAPIPPKEPVAKPAAKPEPDPKTDRLPLHKRGDEANIDSAGVMKVIRASNAAIKRCYDKALITKPSLKGKISVKIVVKEDGTVGNVGFSEDTLRDAEVGKCVKGIIGRLRFPKPEGGPATIVYPYSFSR